MKDFLKFLGIFALVAIIGFSMAGCSSGDDDDDEGGGGGGGGSGVDWPAEFTPSTGALGNKKGDWIATIDGAVAELNIQGAHESLGTQACGLFHSTADLKTDLTFIIKTIDGKKITVNDYSSDVVFCADYTIDGDTLKLTGGEGVFAPYSVTWTKK